jgi:uncharacterized protein YndB with AHSA1/START domain
MTVELVIEHAYYLDGAPEKVFQALTEPKILVKWFLSKAYVDPREGGDYDFDWLVGYHYAGTVMRYEKNKAISYSWARNTTASFEVAKKGQGTLLILRHGQFSDPESFGVASSRWGYYLTNLKSVLRNGTDLRSKYDWEEVAT